MVDEKVLSWEEISAPIFETPARSALRQAVQEVAEMAKAKLPECASRVDKAVALVLNGDVQLLPDGTAHIASQANGTVEYVVCNGECTCKDYPKAPHSFCKHRLAAAIARRVRERTTAQGTTAATDQAPAVSAPAQASSLPEVPAIVSTTITIDGRRVEVKLCDTDDTRLLARLTALLAQYPSEPPTALTTMADDTRPCPKHAVPMKLNHGKDGSTWYSHKTVDGWCKGR